MIEETAAIGSIISPVLLAFLLYKVWKLEYKFKNLPCKPCGVDENEKSKKSG